MGNNTPRRKVAGPKVPGPLFRPTPIPVQRQMVPAESGPSITEPDWLHEPLIAKKPVGGRRAIQDVGRPRINFSAKDVKAERTKRRAANMPAGDVILAKHFGCSVDTIRRREGRKK